MSWTGSGLDAALRAVLACPKCKGDLCFDEAASELVCETCRLRYPVRDGVPVLLVSAAKPSQ